MEASDTVQENISGSNEVIRERKSEEIVNPRILVMREGETPPDDDCCPICFGDFNIPCKTNCGHWYCAPCILMLWNYSSALKCCKCPMCSRLISKLTPEASLTLRREEEVVEALKKVQGYNRLFVGGAGGLIMVKSILYSIYRTIKFGKLRLLPLCFRRFFGGLMDPGRFRFNFYTARFIALLLTVLYESYGFDFIPTGSLGVRRMFEYCAIALVIILCLVGICHRLILAIRARFLAARRPLHA